MSTVKSLHTNLVYALSILFLVLGIMGYLDIKNFTDDGYSSNDYTITKIAEGGSAAVAGLQVGDEILSIGGIDVRETKAWRGVPRTKVGDSKDFVVMRSGEEQSMSLTYAAQSSKDSMLNRFGWTIGLIFLLMGLWSFRSKGSWVSFLFAMFALGFAGSFMGGPHLENDLLDDIVGMIRFSFVLLSFAFLVDFLLHYPKRSSFLDKANANKIIYGPAIFLVLFFFVITLMQVDSTSGLNNFIRIAMLLFVVIFFGWALITVIRNYMNASSEEKSSGMSLMFWGTVLGIVPLLIAFIVGNLMPTVSLPGEDYWFLSMGLIPICFAMAINKS